MLCPALSDEVVLNRSQGDWVGRLAVKKAVVFAIHVSTAVDGHPSLLSLTMRPFQKPTKTVVLLLTSVVLNLWVSILLGGISCTSDIYSMTHSTNKITVTENGRGQHNMRKLLQGAASGRLRTTGLLGSCFSKVVCIGMSASWSLF